MAGGDNVRTALLLDAMGELDHARLDDAAAEKSASEAVRVLSARAKEAGFEPELTSARYISPTFSSALAAGGQRTSVDDKNRIAAQLRRVQRVQRGRHRTRRTHRPGGRRCVGGVDRRSSALAIVATLDLPASATKIDLLRTQADVSSALTHYDAAAADVASALETLRASNPDARVQHAALLAQKVRIAQATGNAERRGQRHRRSANARRGRFAALAGGCRRYRSRRRRTEAAATFFRVRRVTDSSIRLRCFVGFGVHRDAEGDSRRGCFLSDIGAIMNRQLDAILNAAAGNQAAPIADLKPASHRIVERTTLQSASNDATKKPIAAVDAMALCMLDSRAGRLIGTFCLET